MLHISRSASSSWKHIWCFNMYGVFIALADLYQKLLSKNCWCPFMIWNDLGDMARGHWSQYSDSGWQFYLYPDVWKRFEWFSTKRDAFHLFSHWFTMSQYWPDLGSPISKFRCILFIDVITDINRWKFKSERSFDIAMLSFQTFFWGKVTEIFQLPKCCEMFTCEEKMYDSAAVFEISEKNLKEVVQTPPPAQRWLYLYLFIIFFSVLFYAYMIGAIIFY